MMQLHLSARESAVSPAEPMESIRQLALLHFAAAFIKLHGCPSFTRRNLRELVILAIELGVSFSLLVVLCFLEQSTVRKSYPVLLELNCLVSRLQESEVSWRLSKGVDHEQRFHQIIIGASVLVVVAIVGTSTSILLHTDLNINFLLVYIVVMVAHSLQLLFLYHMYQKCVSESVKIGLARQITALASIFVCNGIFLFFGLREKIEGKLIQSIWFVLVGGDFIPLLRIFVHKAESKTPQGEMPMPSARPIQKHDSMDYHQNLEAQPSYTNDNLSSTLYRSSRTSSTVSCV